MNLFQLGYFTLASGQISEFKVDCDALTWADWECLAYMIYKRAGTFTEAVGVPRGGLALAGALHRYAIPEYRFMGEPVRLVVDDVYTTGGSISKYLTPNCKAWVVFARTESKPPIRSLFTLTP